MKVAVFYFKQLPLNTKKKKKQFSYHLIDGERPLLVVVEVMNFSFGKPSDFHDTTFSESPSPF